MGGGFRYRLGGGEQTYDQNLEHSRYLSASRTPPLQSSDYKWHILIRLAVNYTFLVKLLRVPIHLFLLMSMLFHVRLLDRVQQPVVSYRFPASMSLLGSTNIVTR